MGSRIVSEPENAVLMFVSGDGVLLREWIGKRPIAAFGHFIVGIENSAPARKPVGQRAVIVFIRV